MKSKTDSARVGLYRLVVLLVGMLLGIVFYHYLILGPLIDSRANDLGMMHYSAQVDGMIAKPEYQWTLRYLKTGEME